jgi:hypothetical protein
MLIGRILNMSAPRFPTADEFFSSLKLQPYDAVANIDQRSNCTQCGRWMRSQHGLTLQASRGSSTATRVSGTWESRQISPRSIYPSVSMLLSMSMVCLMPGSTTDSLAEREGKSTACHAKILAPDDVEFYIFPLIPTTLDPKRSAACVTWLDHHEQDRSSLPQA